MKNILDACWRLLCFLLLLAAAFFVVSAVVYALRHWDATCAWAHDVVWWR